MRKTSNKQHEWIPRKPPELRCTRARRQTPRKSFMTSNISSFVALNPKWSWIWAVWSKVQKRSGLLPKTITTTPSNGESSHFKPLWQASRLTWGRCKATWDVRRPNGAVDDPFMTSEGGQRWTESRVPLTEIKLTWRRQNADGEGKKGETFILPLSPFDPTIQKLSGFLLESDSSPQCTPAHTSQSEHLCVCLCVCKHVCVTSCVCSLATLSGALWLAVSHSWRLPSPPPATKMCSLASLHATSNRPSLHSQLRHTHTRMT